MNILKSKPQQNSIISHTNQASLSNVLVQNKPRNSSNVITKNSLEQTDNFKE